MAEIHVPQGMMAAYKQGIYAALDVKGYTQDDVDRSGVEAICVWISQNPIVPTTKNLEDMLGSAWSYAICEGTMSGATISAMLQEWQRRMLRAPQVSSK